MASYRTKALVIRARDFSETDKLVTLFSVDKGKLFALAKGARKARSKLRAAVQPFNFISTLMYEGRNLDIISQCEIIEGFKGIREGLAKIAAASVICELVDGLVAEREPAPSALKLCLSMLNTISNRGVQLQILLLAFELRLISLLGYRPETRVCVVCGKEISGEGTWFFSCSQGGLLCLGCLATDPASDQVTKEQLQLMEALLSGKGSVKAGSQLLRRVDFLMEKYISAKMERPIKSLNFFRTVAGEVFSNGERTK